MGVTLIHGEALAEMDKLIKAGIKVDAVIADPPYGTMKNAGLDGWDSSKTNWDNKIDQIELGKRFNKILKYKGAVILFGQEPFTSTTIQKKMENIPFSYRMIWLKDHFANALIAKKAPVSYYEDIMVFFKKYDTFGENPAREYFKEVLSFIGANKKTIISKVGQRADHTFRVNSPQFDLCTKETYLDLIKIFEIDKMPNFKNYEQLIFANKSFASKSPTFNLEGINKKSNVLSFKKEYKTVHPTQKPVALMEYLIKTYTNEGETVLDFTMGSGTTGVAAINNNRNFIGIEMDEKYYKIAKKRCDDTAAQQLQGE